jgi:flavorubredoxin
MEGQPRVSEVWNGTYQINSYQASSDLTFNQYVIDDSQPLLVHTGSVQQFDTVTEALDRVCSLEDLEYVLITHFESDECGALSKFLTHNPDLKPVCSKITARQLDGFGMHSDPVVKGDGDTLDLGSRTLEFIDYPAEMHLWKGVLAYDRTHDGLFCSDLFRRRGPIDDQVVVEDVSLSDIPHDRIPGSKERKTMAERLTDLQQRIATSPAPADRFADLSPDPDESEFRKALVDVTRAYAATGGERAAD